METRLLSTLNIEIYPVKKYLLLRSIDGLLNIFCFDPIPPTDEYFLFIIKILWLLPELAEEKNNLGQLQFVGIAKG